MAEYRLSNWLHQEAGVVDLVTKPLPQPFYYLLPCGEVCRHIPSPRGETPCPGGDAWSVVDGAYSAGFGVRRLSGLTTPPSCVIWPRSVKQITLKDIELRYGDTCKKQLHHMKSWSFEFKKSHLHLHFLYVNFTFFFFFLVRYNSLCMYSRSVHKANIMINGPVNGYLEEHRTSSTRCFWMMDLGRTILCTINWSVAAFLSSTISR